MLGDPWLTLLENAEDFEPNSWELPWISMNDLNILLKTMSQYGWRKSFSPQLWNFGWSGGSGKVCGCSLWTVYGSLTEDISSLKHVDSWLLKGRRYIAGYDWQQAVRLQPDLSFTIERPQRQLLSMQWLPSELLHHATAFAIKFSSMRAIGSCEVWFVNNTQAKPSTNTKGKGSLSYALIRNFDRRRAILKHKISMVR